MRPEGDHSSAGASCFQERLLSCHQLFKLELHRDHNNITSISSTGTNPDLQQRSVNSQRLCPLLKAAHSEAFKVTMSCLPHLVGPAGSPNFKNRPIAVSCCDTTGSRSRPHTSHLSTAPRPYSLNREHHRKLELLLKRRESSFH